jgi:ATP-dependent protease ClpP protease subunit
MNFRQKFSQRATRDFEAGQFVTWKLLGEDHSGRVSQVYKAGKITPAGMPRGLEASQGAPVLELEVFQRTGELWQPTGERVIRAAVSCEPIADLRRPAAYTGCTVVHKDSASVADELIIYSDIGGFDFWTGDTGATAADIREQLKKIPKGKQIDMRVNSPGGDAFEGMAIYNVLTQHAKKNDNEIVGYNDGLVASAATVVMMAADRVIAGETSIYMIHRAFSIAFGSGDDMRTTASLLDKIDGQTIDLYFKTAKANGAKLSRDDIEKMVDDETYMTAQEQVDNGFASEIYDTKGKASQSYGPQRPWLKALPAGLRKQFSQAKTLSRVLNPSDSERAEAA